MDNYFQDHIAAITERDFWGSIRPSAGLKPALDAARAGDSGRAYRLLGAVHAQTLKAEADFGRGSVYLRRLGWLGYGDDPKARRLIYEKAAKVLRHEINGWQSQVITFGSKIDFNADFGQSGLYGFHYLGWLAPVVLVYAWTGQERYRDCFLDILSQYYEQRNRIGTRFMNFHPVYYELGAWAKTGVFLPAYARLAGEEAMTPAQREAMLKLLLGFARSLYQLQAGAYRPGNWQIVGASALFWLGCVFPEFKEAAAWRARALPVILKHAELDFTADGGHGERCWGYGWMSLEAMLHAYEVGVRCGRLGTHKAPLARMLKRAFQWHAAAVSPTHESLNYGDGGIVSEELVLESGRQAFPELAKAPGLLGVDRARSRILRPSGYAFQTGGGGREAPFLSINFGPTGGSHTHDDLLDFTLWAYGEPIIEEVGRFGSYDNPLSAFFRTPQAHNQLVIEHFPMNRQAHRGEQVRWHSDDRVDFFSASHRAYEEVRAVIRRHIVFVKPRYWVIYDGVDAPEKIFQVSSYLHAPRPFRILGPGRARVAGRKSCLVAFAEPGSIRHFITGIDYRRADYTVPGGNAPERHRLAATTWRDIGDVRPITFAMVLMPFRDDKLPDVSIEPLPAEGAKTGLAEAFAVTADGVRTVLAFNPGRVRGFRVQGRALSAPMAARIGGTWVESGRASGTRPSG